MIKKKCKQCDRIKMSFVKVCFPIYRKFLKAGMKCVNTSGRIIHSYPTHEQRLCRTCQKSNLSTELNIGKYAQLKKLENLT